MFQSKFDKYACEGDTIEGVVDEFRFVATIIRDTDSHIDDDDCHNEDQSVTGCDDAQFAKLLAARKAWFDDDWFYCGIVLTVWKGEVKLTDHAASLWGIECNYPDSDNSHLSEGANELLGEAVDEAKRLLDTLLV